MKSPLPPTTYVLASRVVRYVVERLASDVSHLPIRDAQDYLVRHALHLLTPHGLWASCPVPVGVMTDAVVGMVAEALVEELTRTVTP